MATRWWARYPFVATADNNDYPWSAGSMVLTEVFDDATPTTTVVRMMLDVSLAIAVSPTAIGSHPDVWPWQFAAVASVGVASGLDNSGLRPIQGQDRRVTGTGELYYKERMTNAFNTTWPAIRLELQQTIDSKGQRKSPDPGYSPVALACLNVFESMAIWGPNEPFYIWATGTFRVLFEQT